MMHSSYKFDSLNNIVVGSMDSGILSYFKYKLKTKKENFNRKSVLSFSYNSLVRKYKSEIASIASIETNRKLRIIN